MLWSVTPEKVEAAVQQISKTCQPLKIIIFGSYIRGNIDRNSDVDILIVVGDEVINPRQESVRIRRALKGISMPMDILVVPVSRLQKLMNLPGMIYREALQTGKVVYESR